MLNIALNTAETPCVDHKAHILKNKTRCERIYLSESKGSLFRPEVECDNSTEAVFELLKSDFMVLVGWKTGVVDGNNLRGQ